jgi:hypothetical protein
MGRAPFAGPAGHVADERGRFMHIATLAVVALAIGSWPAPVDGAQHRATAHIAHVLNGNDDASLHLVHSSGSQLFEEGHASGALPGSMHADVEVGATLTGTFTLYTHQGQIRGRGNAKPHGTGRYQSFGGTMTITGGTGRYLHAHGSGGFYGEFDRRTYNVTIQTRGRFSY